MEKLGNSSTIEHDRETVYKNDTDGGCQRFSEPIQFELFLGHLIQFKAVFSALFNFGTFYVLACKIILFIPATLKRWFFN